MSSPQNYHRRNVRRFLFALKYTLLARPTLTKLAGTCTCTIRMMFVVRDASSLTSKRGSVRIRDWPPSGASRPDGFSAGMS